MSGSDKTANLVSTKEVDYLDVDKSIRGQNYVLLSFLSPEDVIVNKDAYYFSRFLKQFGKDMNTLFDGITAKFPESKEMIDSIRNNHCYISDENEMNDQYNFFKSVNSADIESDYHRDNNFQTTVRGIKVRGVFDSIDEAKNRSEFIKKVDNKFDIFIGEVGCWCPWSPNPNDLQNQEYAETQLNTLMKKYQENSENRDQVFEKRRQESINTSKTTSEVSELTDTFDKVDPWSERKSNDATEVTEDSNEIVN